jgi:hypothetical protein
LDLKKQFEKIKDEVISVTEEVFHAQHFILGPKVEELEKGIAKYCHCNYAVGVSSGTDALLISLMTGGVGMGDLVITSPYTFFATAGSIARVGATPVFVDINEYTYNLDPLELEKRISRLDKKQISRLKAIMPVHLFGQCADMEPILEIADRRRCSSHRSRIGIKWRFNKEGWKHGRIRLFFFLSIKEPGSLRGWWDGHYKQRGCLQSVKNHACSRSQPEILPSGYRWKFSARRLASRHSYGEAKISGRMDGEKN